MKKIRLMNLMSNQLAETENELPESSVNFELKQEHGREASTKKRKKKRTDNS